VILIDTPPVTEYADAAAITFRAGDALMISRKDHTRLADTEQAMRDLGDASARVVGSLMNAY
jgi:Mrp family chromosome partitioning ATPase